jgi:hypothetical protein
MHYIDDIGQNARVQTGAHEPLTGLPLNLYKSWVLAYLTTHYTKKNLLKRLYNANSLAMPPPLLPNRHTRRLRSEPSHPTHHESWHDYHCWWDTDSSSFLRSTLWRVPRFPTVRSVHRGDYLYRNALLVTCNGITPRKYSFVTCLE